MDPAQVARLANAIDESIELLAKGVHGIEEYLVGVRGTLLGLGVLGLLRTSLDPFQVLCDPIRPSQCGVEPGAQRTVASQQVVAGSKVLEPTLESGLGQHVGASSSWSPTVTRTR